MKKALASLTALFSSSALIAVASAQTPEPGNSAGNLVGEAIAVVIVVAVVAFLVYAGYKVVRKWSRGGPD